MKMNDTVARIVEIMFQDVVKNEETDAIRDEVMNNCQERFSDLVTSGINEDDAIAAVVESLKGMDEILAPYKNPAKPASDDENEIDKEQRIVYAGHMVHSIDVLLVREDVNIEASDDENFHVIWDADENPLVYTKLVDGVLKVERRPGEPVNEKINKTEAEFKADIDGFIKTDDGKIEINMESISRTMKCLGDKIKMQFSNGMGISFGTASGAVTIQVPENVIPHVKLLTTSGDIDVQDVALADLNITSTSGDIDVDLGEDQCLESIEMRTTSGDMEMTAYTDRASIASTSGDVEVNGRYDKLSIGTISGDIDVRAEVVDMNFSAVSGDVEMQFESSEIRKVCGSTVSGDIEIDLPDGIGTMAIQTQTRSGDVTTRCHTDGVGPTVTGGVSSMSGDITIR